MNRAVFCAGGGVLGAFEAGVLTYLMEHGMSFDIAAGISTGALQAVIVAQNKISLLEKVWTSIKGNSDIYTYWPGRFILSNFGLVAAPWSTTPLRALLEKYVDVEAVRKSKTALYIGATNWRTGELEFATNTTQDLITWLMASSAFPPFFPPQQPEGKDDWYVDGGVRSSVPVDDLADLDWDEGHVILARSIEAPPDGRDRPYGFKYVTNRVLTIAFNEIMRGDLRDSHSHHRNGRKMFIYQPPPDIALPGALEFDPVFIRKMFDLGLSLARTPYQCVGTMPPNGP